MRLLQLSDPHLLADPRALYRGRNPLQRLQQALAWARRQPALPDLLLISGDLCQDESWGGYVRLRELLAGWPTPVALLPGNHDHPQLLRAALGRRARLAPADLDLGGVRLLLLDSHRSGRVAGWLGERQLAWLAARLQAPDDRPLLVALHHPPVPIGSAELDAIALNDAPHLLPLLQRQPQLRAVLFGHVHQHWQGWLPGRPDVPLFGCPSTLCGFGPVQPCPLGRPHDPGGRWLELGPQGGLVQRLLRWSASPPDAA
jgi:Icc protein